MAQTGSEYAKILLCLWLYMVNMKAGKIVNLVYYVYQSGFSRKIEPMGYIEIDKRRFITGVPSHD